MAYEAERPERGGAENFVNVKERGDGGSKVVNSDKQAYSLAKPIST